MSAQRSHDGSPKASKPAPGPAGKSVRPRQPPAASSPYMPMFEAFRAELDEHQDRRERVIKASRDITALSKKMVRELRRPLPDAIAAETAPRAAAIADLLRPRLAADLAGAHAHRYARQISPGLQELVEAAVFRHYLATQTLLDLDATRAELGAMLRQAATAQTSADTGMEGGVEGRQSTVEVDAEAAGRLPGEEDWLLGVFDAVGELMRWAITAMATGGAIPGAIPSPTNDTTDNDNDGGNGSDGDNGAMEVDSHRPTTGAAAAPAGRTMVTDLRALRAQLEALRTRGAGVDRDVPRKMEVMRACVDKVEAACYGLLVRGSERPKGWVPAADEGGPRAEAVEGY